MADERVTESTDGVTTQRTVERDTGTTVIERRGSGAGVVLGILALAAVVLLAWFLLSQNRNDTVRTEAVTGAASSVADSAEKAADSVGDAVKDK